MDPAVKNQTLKPNWQPMGEMTFAATGCPLCGGLERARSVFIKKIRTITMRYFLCGNCDVLFANPHADADSLKRLYASRDFFEGGRPGSDHLNYHQFISGETYLRKTARDRMGRILKFSRGGRLLEIASAAGFFLIEAKQAGFEVEGVEISEPLADYSAKRWQVPVRAASAEETELGKSEWDVIVSWGVMTILRDPRRFAAKVYEALKPGGLWALNTYYHEGAWPKLISSRWDILTVNMNQIFSRRALCRLAETAGFRLVSRRRERPYTDLDKLADKGIQILGMRWMSECLRKSKLGSFIIRLPLSDVYEYLWQRI